MSVLDPISHVLAAILAIAHSGLTRLGADPGSGTTWVLCVATVVVAVRVALLPLVVHGVRQAHAAARARPQLADLTKRYRNRKDAESMRSFMNERRRIAAEHNMSRMNLLPVLIQLPIWVALYHLLSNVASGAAVGAVTPHLVASLGAATLLGMPLADRGYLGAGWPHLAVVGGLAVTAAILSYVTQRFLIAPNTVLADVPDVISRTHQLMPALSALGLLVAGGTVPVALLIYWVCNSVWTLGQSAVIWRWFPTPGSPAATHAPGSK
jgi:YidC/Oxa1 family membrane protein insertase